MDLLAPCGYLVNFLHNVIFKLLKGCLDRLLFINDLLIVFSEYLLVLLKELVVEVCVASGVTIPKAVDNVV